MDDFVLSRTGPRARDQWPGPKGGPVARAQGGPSGQGPRGAQWPRPKGGPVTPRGGSNGMGQESNGMGPVIQNCQFFFFNAKNASGPLAPLGP